MVAHPCPSDDQLLAFVEGLLASAQREETERHLAGCSDCSAVVGATYRAPQPSASEAIGRYQILEEVGRGGMGRVVRARDPSLDRDVAIKLILATALSPAARKRFSREAKALGRLRHPHVLEVFDVGESLGAPYFVMELVEGLNLDVWSRGRDPRQVLDCLRGAGQGLAAAHAQDILHRDFKPSNVLVGADGQAKVADFGLAGFEVTPTAPAAGGGSVDSLTKTGATMGTLAYLAPELHGGAAASVLSDQFAFCVTMHEVLYGSRPFEGTDARTVSTLIQRGEVPPAPSDVAVPPRVRRALVRGLSCDPSARFPSMQALLHELRPARGRGTTFGLLAGSSVLVAAVVFGVSTGQASPCDALAHELEGSYNTGARDRIEAAFAASALPYAKASSRSTLEGLDAYAAAWVDGAQRACRASEREEIPGAALDLRMRCFRHAAQSLDAMVDELEAPRDAHIERGGELVAELPNLLLCSDIQALERLSVIPANAAEAEQAETLGPVLSQAYAKSLVEDYDGAWALLEQHSPALDAATYPPICVRTAGLRARVLLQRDDFAAARAAGLRAHELAVEHRLDRDASRSATLLGNVAARQGNGREAQRWFDVALALAEAGGFDQLQASALTTASQYYEKLGQLDRAVDAARRAVELTEDDAAYPRTSRAEALLAFADRLYARGGGEDGLAQLEEAQRIFRSLHGDTHPSLGGVERSLQMRASRRGDYEGSYRHGREALRITLALEDEGSLRVIAARVNMAIALKELGRFEGAGEELRHADRLLEKLPAHRPAMRIPLLTNLANVMLGLGDNDGAREALSQARTLLEARPDQRERSVLIDGQLSRVELRDGNLDAARRLASGALDVSIDVFGEDHFHTADLCTRLGHVELETQNWGAARELLSRALAVEDTTEADRGEATFLLARATFEDPEAGVAERARGLELARSAKLALTAKPAYARLLDEATTWLVHRTRSD